MRLAVDFSEVNETLEAFFIQTHCTFDADFGEVFLIKTDDVYQGPYDVIPRVYEQILDTKDKVMIDDVTVEIIPLTKIINQSNGYTVTIG